MSRCSGSRELGGAKDLVAKIDVVVRQSGRVSSSPKVMARQLELLDEALNDPGIMAAVANRNGPATSAKLRQAVLALRAEDRATAARPGTAAETQLMDLLDGIIVELVQQARKSAEAAAAERGDPALAKAFKLDKLYRGARRRRPEGAEAPDDAEDIDEVEDDVDDSDADDSELDS